MKNEIQIRENERLNKKLKTLEIKLKLKKLQLEKQKKLGLPIYHLKKLKKLYSEEVRQESIKDATTNIIKK